jgi:hypothetical protein
MLHRKGALLCTKIEPFKADVLGFHHVCEKCLNYVQLTDI